MPSLLFWLLLLSVCICKRLQTFLAVAKCCLLLIDVYFFLLENEKKPVVCQKVCFKLYAPILEVLGNLYYSTLFVSYGIVKILTSYFSHGASL